MSPLIKEQFLDIPYSASPHDPFLQFDLYLTRPLNADPLRPRPPLICFVHGGAWRSEDKKDHADLARSLASHTNLPVVVPNYRLTPQSPTEQDTFHHPGHACDILECLSFLMSWEGLPGLRHIYDSQRIYLLGHSCGAHMLSSIFLDSSSITPCLTPPTALLQAIQGIIMSEGIYDIDALLSYNPDYRSWFVQDAFGIEDSYAHFSVTNYPPMQSNMRWLLIHSHGDTLVNMKQSQLMYEHLCRSIGSDSNLRVEYHTEAFNELHDDVLKSKTFVELITAFITQNETS
ncbi:hypothetical protein AX17_003334 [Amanita inopinata Kibby_2008]|nr:hypothetical protein AX17_003334 [Amanita inopinata Kibby_2008]